MHNIKANLYNCAHCGGSGTCKNGENETSCLMCSKENEIKGHGHRGLPCSVCGGIGQAEPRTERINKRMPALLGFSVVFILIISLIITAVLNSQYFNQLQSFSGPIVGAIIGYYFSNRSIR